MRYTEITPVVFTHTTFKSDVIIYAEQVFAVFFAPTMKSVCILGPGGAAVPVDCSIDEANEKLQAALAAKPQVNQAKEA
jgi:hypothetical protein